MRGTTRFLQRITGFMTSGLLSSGNQFFSLAPVASAEPDMLWAEMLEVIVSRK